MYLGLAKIPGLFFLFFLFFLVIANKSEFMYPFLKKYTNQICPLLATVCPPFWGLKLPSQPILKVRQLWTQRSCVCVCVVKPTRRTTLHSPIYKKGGYVSLRHNSLVSLITKLLDLKNVYVLISYLYFIV